jgi:replicative DNA helicase
VDKLKVGVFSLEMSSEQLLLRILCSEAHIDSQKLRTGKYLSKEEWTKITRTLGELSKAKLFIDDTAGISLLETRAKARRLKAEHGLDLLIVDYMQLMSGGKERYENRQQEISTISRGLKGLAKELNIPVVALSQLSRAPEQRTGDHRPQLSDLRESGSIEQDADVVLFIFREEKYKPTEENRGIAEIIIGKQRNGPTGMIKLAFIDSFTRFENLYRETE